MTEEAKTPDSTLVGVSDSTQLLAAKIARGIFAEGDQPLAFGGRALRIQFMGGHWPNAEKPMGGFCEEALAQCIERVLTAN